MRILLVEDDDVLRDGIVAGLGLDGFEVDAVATVAPPASWIATTGCVVNAVPATAPDGCVWSWGRPNCARGPGKKYSKEIQYGR